VRRAARVVCLSSAIAALTLVCATGQAAAQGCGATITTNTTLTHDLTDCSGNGIVIGADDITLDLNGHTIDGEVAFGSGSGVKNSGFDGVTIENGTIQEFHFAGVELTDAANNHVRGLDLQSMFFQGIFVEGSSAGTLVEDNRADALGIAISIDASNLRVERNVATGNAEGGSGKVGPLAVFGDDNRIEGNNVRLVNVDGAGTGVGEGSLVVGGDRNQIVGNTANDGDHNGIVVASDAIDNLLRGNLAERNGQLFRGFGLGDGIVVEGGSTTMLSSNSANFNEGIGINQEFGTAKDLGRNRAQGNTGSAQCVGVSCDSSPTLLGRRAASTSYSGMSANVKRATPFPLFFPVTVRKLSAYLDGRGATTGSQVLTAIIYRNATGGPTELVARSFQVTIPAGRDPGWVDFYLPFPPRLQPGVYWLGIHSGASGGVARFAWDPAANSRRFNIDAYSDGPSSPFGTSLIDNQQMSIYASGSY
jgi:parallel beta-helix repeat protein